MEAIVSLQTTSSSGTSVFFVIDIKYLAESHSNIVDYNNIKQDE